MMCSVGGGNHPFGPSHASILGSAHQIRGLKWGGVEGRGRNRRGQGEGCVLQDADAYELLTDRISEEHRRALIPQNVRGAKDYTTRTHFFPSGSAAVSLMRR